MYIPPHFAEERPEVLAAFIRRYNFALLSIADSAGSLQAVHLPLLLRAASTTGERPEHGVIMGHVARANPIWQLFDGSREALAVFSGPHAYVSPSWYVTRPQVPTWNYTAVHAYGAPRVVEDEAFSLSLLEELVQSSEAATKAAAPNHRVWEMQSEMDYVHKLLPGILSFEMPIRRLEGKFKLNQNRGADNRAGVISALERIAPDVAELMRDVEDA